MVSEAESKPTADAPVGPVRFRPFKSVVMCSALAVFVIVAFIVVGLLLRRSDTGVAFQVADQVAMIILGFLIAAGILLWATPLVTADAERVEVRNILVKRTYEWSQVLSISFPDGASFARLELPDDEYYSVMAVQAVDGWRAVEAVRTLRKLHRDAWESRG